VWRGCPRPRGLGQAVRV